MSNQPDQSNQPDAPAQQEFDIEAARLRYRRMMRGRTMRLLFGATLLILMCSWIYAGIAVVASDVEGLPGHDLTVPKAQCIDCHARRIDGAPAFNHSFAPSCGFCHRQSPPPAQGSLLR